MSLINQSFERRPRSNISSLATVGAVVLLPFFTLIDTLNTAARIDPLADPNPGTGDAEYSFSDSPIQKKRNDPDGNIWAMTYEVTIVPRTTHP